MDPNVQVAIATVIGTTITTLGIVAVAFINRGKGGQDDGVDDPDSKSSDPDVLTLVQSLILENARKEKAIVNKDKTIESLKRENEKLRNQLAATEGST